MGFRTWDEITLGLPDWDEKIEAMRTLLRNIGEADIPMLTHNFKPAGNFRTASVPSDWGGAVYSTFDYDELMKDPPHFPEKAISEAQIRENLKTYLERVIPVAEEAGVRMAMHPAEKVSEGVPG